MHKISILVTDDHTLVREAWVTVLNSDPRFTVIAEASNAEEAIEKVKELRPEIAILDINLPGISGIEAIPLIRKFSPGTKILGVSLHTQPIYARKMMQKGARGYVTKNSSRMEMFKALLEIHEGRSYICEEIKNILSDQAMSGKDPSNGLNSLSQREMEIIRHIRNGSSSKEIAETLFLSVKTVEVHRYNILKKLQLKNSAALVNFVSQLDA
jgi:DNA-binding NarL/FixJ family response regulator